jgi:hypothetical protein
VDLKKALIPSRGRRHIGLFPPVDLRSKKWENQNRNIIQGRYAMKRFTLAVSVAFLLLLALPRVGSALDIGIGGLDVEIGGGPPPVRVSGRVELLPIAGRYAYFIPGIDADIFFYRGGWYRPYKGRWFRSDRYDGRWERIHDVPSALIDLPSDYRRRSGRFNPIPYRDVRNNWERWEQEKHWSMPPAVEFARPVELLPIAGRYAYFVPGIDVDIFFYRGSWYRPYEGGWFRSDRYDGRWERIHDAPSALIDLPSDYRKRSGRFNPLPYREVGTNWERWEHEKRWDRTRGEERRRYEERERDQRDEMEQYPGEQEKGRY